MEMQDLGVIALYALFFCCPLGSIYLTLKFFNWNQKRKLLSDSWFVFLVWLFSSLIILFFGAVIDNTRSLRIENDFLKFTAIIFILLIVNSLTVTATLMLTRKVEKTEDIFGIKNEEIMPKNNQNVWKVSVSISIVTILTVLTLLSIVIGIGNLIETIYPKQKNSFEIYDI
jgi:quinol-cytochrome oxidoreductase complex cytochrome b subunit